MHHGLAAKNGQAQNFDYGCQAVNETAEIFGCVSLAYWFDICAEWLAANFHALGIKLPSLIRNALTPLVAYILRSSSFTR